MCNCVRAADLINNGKFNYGAFNGIPKYKQDALIAPYKNFLERYGGFKFILSDKDFRVLTILLMSIDIKLKNIKNIMYIIYNIYNNM